MSDQAKAVSPETDDFSQKLANTPSEKLSALFYEQKNIVFENIGGGLAITVIGGIVGGVAKGMANSFSNNAADIVGNVVLAGIGVGLVAAYYTLTKKAVTAHKNTKLVSAESKKRKKVKNNL